MALRELCKTHVTTTTAFTLQQLAQAHSCEVWSGVYAYFSGDCTPPENQRCCEKFFALPLLLVPCSVICDHTHTEQIH